jgi:choline dehydrogenase-like flavoprotein
MQVEDLRFEHEREIDTDLCLVGSGPAGLTIANEFAGTAVKVLVLESGGLVEEPESDAQSKIESIGAPRTMEPTLVRNRILGGSSHTWNGKCAPLDDIDFEARPWVPFSGWPISRASLAPYLDRASSYVGIVPYCHERPAWALLGQPPPNPDVNTELLKPMCWQYSNDSDSRLHDPVRFGRRFLSSSATNIRTLLHATVTHVTTNETGSQVRAVEIIGPDGKRTIVRAKVLVLCAGGIENARLLLCSNRIVRKGVGNANDLVGRFLMDHPRCYLGEFDPTEARLLRYRYGLCRVNGEGRGHFFLDGLVLSPNFQKKKQLLNCAAWIEGDKAVDDPWTAAKRLVFGPDRDITRDAWYFLSQPRHVVRGLSDHFVRRTGVMGKIQRLLLHCWAEQRPDPESRIRLSERKDRLGMPLAQLDWKISEQEKATVAVFGQLITDEFRRIGLPVPALAEWVRSGRYDQAEFIDAAHPTGTTRMARDPREGVVDENCQVHGVEGIFVAGSSVFPTNGHANPTLMIVALAIRLAAWLKVQHFR